MGDDPSPVGKETPPDDPKNDVAKGETKGDGQPPDKHGPTGDNKETTPGEAKGGPGNGARPGTATPRRPTTRTAPPATPEKPVEQKASVLQLRKFLDTVDKKVLEDAKRDPAAMKKLQEEARKWLAEHPPGRRRRARSARQQGGASAARPASRSNPDGKTATDDPDNGGRPLPPPRLPRPVQGVHQAALSRRGQVRHRMTFPLRYLVRFGPKQTTHLFTDLLVIGGGIAGLRAALAAPPDMQVLVVTKDKVQHQQQQLRPGRHRRRALAGGPLREPHRGHADGRRRPVRPRRGRGGGARGAGQIDDLIRYGAHFDAEMGMEGGHSHHRIVHALGDATGFEVMRAIIDRARRAANITIWDRTFTLDLLTARRPLRRRPVRRGRRDHLLIWAKQTILASGGAGMVYRETTNPPVATGDGMAAAYRAGAELRDMEFMQFHPTVLYVAGSSRYLISEAVRGEGAYLRDKNGVRFMPEEDPRGELATRDVVARAIVRRMERTQHPNVYLDLSHLDPGRVRAPLPRHRQGVPRVRPGHHHATRSRCGPAPITWSAA